MDHENARAPNSVRGKALQVGIPRLPGAARLHTPHCMRGSPTVVDIDTLFQIFESLSRRLRSFLVWRWRRRVPWRSGMPLVDTSNDGWEVVIVKSWLTTWAMHENATAKISPNCDHFQSGLQSTSRCRATSWEEMMQKSLNLISFPSTCGLNHNHLQTANIIPAKQGLVSRLAHL